MIYITTFLTALFLSLIFSPLTITISKRFNIFSKPRDGGGAGKPCLGGIAIYSAFITACAISYVVYPECRMKLPGFVFSATAITLLGLIDDIKDLNPGLKIIVELTAAAVLIIFGISVRIFFLPVWVNIIITLLWVLFITNAFNLLDIVDGLTAGLVVIISLVLFVISLVNRDLVSALILVSLIGSHLGFLRYNYPPARLYMGDTGSLFSGFLLAAVAINISYAPLERPVALLAPIIVMSLPIYDTIFLIIMRARKGKPIFNKSGDHFALRLVTMGYSIRKSVWIMYLFSLFLAAASLVVAFGSNMQGIITLIILLSVFIVMGKKVGMVNVK